MSKVIKGAWVGDSITATAEEINAAADGSTAYLVLPDVSAYTLRASQTGKTVLVPGMTADVTISLPSAADGLRFKFVYVGGAEDAQDWWIDTGSNTNYFIGGVLHLDLNAGSANDEVVTVYSDGNSNSRLNVLTPGAGTVIDVWCDGTNWYIFGKVVSATSPTMNDQA